MSKKLVTHEPQQVSTEQLTKYLESAGIAANLTKQETQQFIEIAQAFRLNPFKREIYAIKYSKDANFSIVVGYETYIKRAEATGMLAGWAVRTEGKASDNSLRAIVTIHRKDWEHPFEWEAWFFESVSLKSNGQPTSIWKTRPAFMTKKVAIGQAFRLCFSDAIGGMPYTSDEINTEPDQPIDVEYTEEVSQPEAKGKYTACSANQFTQLQDRVIQGQYADIKEVEQMLNENGLMLTTTQHAELTKTFKETR